MKKSWLESVWYEPCDLDHELDERIYSCPIPLLSVSKLTWVSIWAVLSPQL